LSSVRQHEEENKQKAEGRNMLHLTWTMVLQWANINWLKSIDS